MSRPTKVTAAMVRAVFKSAGKVTNAQLAAELKIAKRTVQAIRAGTLLMDDACQKAWHQCQAVATGCRNRAETRVSPSKTLQGTSPPTQARKPAKAPILPPPKSVPEPASLDAPTRTAQGIKTGPKGSQAANLLVAYGISQRAIAAATGMNRSVVSRLLAHGEWPRANGEQLVAEVLAYLQSRGLNATQIQTLCDALAVRRLRHRRHAATAKLPLNPEAIPTTDTAKDHTMLLKNEALSPEARKHFCLPRNPFVDEMHTPADVFQTASVRYVRAALMDAALNHSLLAVVGESGAGKSTLAEDLEERIKEQNREVQVIRPYVLGMEANDDKGKTLKASHIAEAIATALDPALQIKSSPQARFAQVHELLKASRRAGRRHLLLIEEAHCLPLATLKHLKRFLELKDGMQRLIGVALIGQPELRERLGSQNAEVREVMQRCEVVELEPLNAELEGYLAHKFARMDVKLDAVMAPDAMDAIRARLVYLPRGGRPQDARSLCYPLVVNNLVCRALNAAARISWPTVEAQVVAGC